MSVQRATNLPNWVPDRIPPCPDKFVWDNFLSVWHMPSLAAASEVRLFDALAEAPATAEELAANLQLDPETLKAMLPLLCALGYLEVRLGRYQPTATAQTYLLTSSPYYWPHAFGVHARLNLTVHVLRALGVAPPEDTFSPADAWESGELGEELGRQIGAIMNSHSVPAALAAAQLPRFRTVRHVMDVGGGSGCFSIALVRANPGLKATVMELPAMCTVAQRYITDSGVADAVQTRAVDMFREEWPRGHDACFFSNVFHDWSPETNRELAVKAFASLPSGGTIHLHEMLIDEDGAGPLSAASFSMLMRIGTRGRQYSAPELADFLESAGFRDVEATHSYGYFSVVSATKA